MENKIKPREKALKYGIHKLSDYELIALLINTGTKESSVIETSKKLISAIGGIENIPSKSLEHFTSVKGIGNKKGLTILAISEIYKRISMNNDYLGKSYTLKNLYEYVKPFFINCDSSEKLVTVFVNKNNILIGSVEMNNGKGNLITMNKRELIRQTYIFNSNRIILIHNHINGSKDPSNVDVINLSKLKIWLLIKGITMVDAYIYSNNSISLINNL